MTKDQLLKLTQDEMRRRCILGRLSDVAESVWTLFSGSSTGASSTLLASRKRGAMRVADVAAAVIKSSKVPISEAEARESLEMLAKLCPFFLRPLNITGDEWLEMPAPSAPAGDEDEKGRTVVSATPAKASAPARKAGPSKIPLPASPSRMPASPGRLRDSAEQLLTRSPRSVKREGGGLREVRERIRREIELQD